MHPTHDDVLKRVAAGDKRAFSDLYDELSPNVMGVCMHILRNPQLAEEVAQEVFIEIWRKAGSFEPAKAAARTWVLRMARSRAIDRLRSMTAEMSRDHKDATLNAVTRFDSVEDAALASVEAVRLRRAIDRVGEPHRSALLLSYFGGLSNPELAAHTNIPLGTAKTRVRDGLKKLRQALLSTPEGGHYVR
ncbi:sigma-70 family RNA polymerase sigma factor [Corynebacterium sp. ES2775-CONJ]|uniref:sigma-70 family RNA polymerase sigma factor n=1 Tax=Corynebacterium sp. ES2775-CONJ TaxID=2974029 RepID=UPI002168277A|nr:sigma-70 family RNA polymerase sigma factor [Corynebacterium sp. ES2775-CONJ]MCS4490702.1 sigma-70 family RNA polymerase sigma factor [Corynebacterium sp. ES2775-CONJ]